MDRRLKRRREKILDAALEIFREDGFERASIDRIVQRSGGSKATLYKLFENKEGLFRAIQERAAIRVGDSTRPVPLPSDRAGLEELLRSTGDAIVTHVLNEGIIGIYRLSVEGARFSPEIGRLYYEGGPVRAQGDFARLLSRLQDAGLVDISDPALASAFFFSMILENYHLTMSLEVSGPPDEAERRRFVDGAVQVFMAAYAR